MVTIEKKLLESLPSILRHDFPSFVAKCFLSQEGKALTNNWHIWLVCEEIMRCAKGKNKRLILTMPPRSLKSFIVSVALPAFLMGHDPRKKIITISYNQELATKFSHEQRQIMQSEWYQEIFPNARLSLTKSKEDEFETTFGGYRLASSIDGTLTGRGADLIIIDDPIKPNEALSDIKRKSRNEWFGNTVASRLNDKKKGSIILVMQRVHEMIMAGYLTEKGGWIALNLPAIAQEDRIFQFDNGQIREWKKGEPLQKVREPLTVLGQIKKDIGSFNFTTQYLQRPTPLEGNIVKAEWFKYYKLYPSEYMVIQSWNIAMTKSSDSDYSACTTWMRSKGKYYLMDVFRGKLEYPQLKRKITQMRDYYGAKKILIEDCTISIALVQQLRDEGVYITKVKPVGDKVERLMAASLSVEAGNVLFPQNHHGWKDDFIAELLSFPGRNDDQVDSFSQFINWAEHQRRNAPRMIEL